MAQFYCRDKPLGYRRSSDHFPPKFKCPATYISPKPLVYRLRAFISKYP
jgi:hypothetical protein